MSIVVPFNFQPYTSSIKTSSYTPAAGVYAYATPLNYDCAIDATNVMLVGTSSYSVVIGANEHLLVASISGSDVSTVSVSSGSAFSVSCGGLLLMTGLSSFSTTIYGNSLTPVASAGTSATPTGGAPVYATGTTSQTVTVTVNNYKSHLTQGFWVDENNALTGAKWHVVEYTRTT